MPAGTLAAAPPHAPKGSEADASARNDGLAVALGNAVAERVLQRSIGFDRHASTLGRFYRVLNNQGQITRPAWSGQWAHHVSAFGTSRNHIVAFMLISEALTNVINKMHYALCMGLGLNSHGQFAAYHGICNALYPSATGAEYTQMVQERNALTQAIVNVANPLNPTQHEENQLEAAATALERSLASAPENVRVGNAGLNTRLGSSSDPVFNAQLTTLTAPLPTWSAAAAPAALPANTPFFTLAPTANAIVYSFMSAAAPWLGHDITITRNDDPGNMVPGYPVGAPLSSSPLPPGAGNQPVIATDPTGAGFAYRFG